MDVVTSSADPEPSRRAADAFRERWPEFIFHDPISKEYLARVWERFPEFDVILRDGPTPLAGA